MRIQCPENSRVPAQGSSAQGQSGPKVRPKGVIDGKKAYIPSPFFISPEGRTNEEKDVLQTWQSGSKAYFSLHFFQEKLIRL